MLLGMAADMKGYLEQAGWLPSKPKITLANLAKVDKFLLSK